MQPELCIFSLAYIHNIYTTFNSAQLTMCMWLVSTEDDRTVENVLEI